MFGLLFLSTLPSSRMCLRMHTFPSKSTASVFVTMDIKVSSVINVWRRSSVIPRHVMMYRSSPLYSPPRPAFRTWIWVPLKPISPVPRWTWIFPHWWHSSWKRFDWMFSGILRIRHSPWIFIYPFVVCKGVDSFIVYSIQHYSFNPHVLSFQYHECTVWIIAIHNHP